MTAKGERAHISKIKEKEIAIQVWENPDMTPELLADKIEEKIKWEGKIPEHEVLVKKVRKYRKCEGPQDQTWCLATLGTFPISAVTIPIILLVQRNAQRRPQTDTPKVGEPVGGPFTIREAQWAARLSFIGDIVSLGHWAHAYAIAERAQETLTIRKSGAQEVKAFDSSNMDAAILSDWVRSPKPKNNP